MKFMMQFIQTKQISISLWTKTNSKQTNMNSSAMNAKIGLKIRNKKIIKKRNNNRWLNKRNNQKLESQLMNLRISAPM